MKMGIVNMKRFGNRMLIEVETMSVIFPLLRWFCINVGGAGVEPFDLPVLHFTVYILEKLNDCLLESRMHKYMETWHKPKLDCREPEVGSELSSLIQIVHHANRSEQITHANTRFVEDWHLTSMISGVMILIRKYWFNYESIVDLWSIVIFSRIIFSAELRNWAVRITVMWTHILPIVLHNSHNK